MVELVVGTFFHDDSKWSIIIGTGILLVVTGVAMIGAERFLEGKWTTKGVHSCEEFDPDPFMAALKKQGLPWKETFKPVKVP